MGRPNLLLVMIDCMRADFFYKERGPDRTPNLDMLLGKGSSFTSFYSVTTTTTPCTATVLTGMYPITHGVRAHSGYRLRPDVKTLTRRLRSAGYHTVARMTGPLGPETDIYRGFHDYEHRGRRETVFNGFGDRFFDELRDFRSQRPWFVFLHIWVMHMPLPAKPRESLTFRFPVGPLLRAIQNLDNSTVWKKILFEMDLLSPLTLLYKKTAYERTLMSLDRAFLSRLVQEVDPDDTLLAVIGDHGEFVDHRTDTLAPGLELYKRPAHGFHVYEYLTRVPFFICGPGISSGRDIGILSSQIDIAPTLLSALKIEYPRNRFEGQDLLELLSNESLPNRPIFMEAVGGGNLEHNRYIRAVRYGKWKLAEAPGMPEFREELYDIQQDPLERCNLRQCRSGVAERLKGMLAQQFANDGDSPGSQYDETTRMSVEEQSVVEERLRELGYID